ncbi:MAG: hypothetical protein JW709_12830 [Sedimentisphaerales bacterium]|nr:hypothetical protein [Sedimentisphaerales bacterium]
MKFRWELIWIPLAMIGVLMAINVIANTAVPAFSLDDMFEMAGIENNQRARMLICLLAVVIVSVFIVKILESDKENKK